jgi:NADH-quinone oxidoreductase subunit E
MHIFCIYLGDFINYCVGIQAYRLAQEVNMPTKSLVRILKGRRSQPSQLVEVLQDVQEESGYVSEIDMRSVSQGLGVPLIEVYRVASFYKAFRLKPTGKIVLTICRGTACHVRSSSLLLDQAMAELGIELGEVTADGLFSIECVNCLGACSMGPIVKENETYHDHMTPGKFRKLIKMIRRREMEEEKNAKA